MDGAGHILIFVIFAIVAAIGGYLAHQAAKKRREAMLALANRLGMSYWAAHDASHDEEYAHFEVFRRGFGRSAFNTLSGQLELNGQRVYCKMGDFKYKTREGSGKNRRTVTHRFSYLILHLPYPNTPDLLIRREGVFDKLASAFGKNDIDFESAEFSRKFFVKSPNRKFAYDIIHPRTIEFLLETNPPVVDIERGRLCMTDGTRIWQPEKFETEAAWVESFLGHWPDFILKDLEQGVLR